MEHREITRKDIDKGLVIFKETGECPGCGYRVDGIFRTHNMNEECWLFNRVKIGPLIDLIEVSLT